MQKLTLFLFVDILSETNSLGLLPPIVQYLKAKGSTKATISQYACTPQSVVAWEGFKDDVNGVTWDNTQKYVKPGFWENKGIYGEEDVREALNFNVLKPLNAWLASKGAGEEFSRGIASGQKVIGEPDFILSCNRKLRLAIEVKTKWSLSASDLVEAYAKNLVKHKADINSPVSVYHQVEQIFGYLSHNNLQYGVLTNYENTWFLHRPRENLGQLRVSPPIPYNNQWPTLFQCFFYLTSLARNNHRCGSPPVTPPPLPPPPRYVSSVEGEHIPLELGERIPLEFFGWGSFSILSVLGTGHSGTVFKAILHGEVVALKICDLWQHPEYTKELLNEVKMYHALRELQGQCIPKFKGAGYTAGGLFAIATDIVGSPVEDMKSLNNQERLLIQTALSSIHRHGIVHNDIREDNILIKRYGSQFHASFIDFAFSKRGSWHDCQKEMETLCSLSRTTIPPQQGSKDSWRLSAATLKGRPSINPIHRLQSTLGRKPLYLPSHWSNARAIHTKFGSLLRHL